jgi:Ras-related protein Rab-18
MSLSNFSYYRDSSGAILVYDVTKKSSFQKLDSWLEELEMNTNRNVTKIVVGNKIDLSSERSVDREAGKAFAKKKRCLFLECSAKQDTNVQLVFSELVKKILEDNILDDNNMMGRNDIRLSHQSANASNSNGYCSSYCGR